MSNFDYAIDFVFAVEGYVSNHKADAGGYTKYGIAQKANPGVDVKNLTLDGAKKIYRKNYWDACKCDSFDKRVGLYVMDYAVNSGVATSAKALQRCANRLISGKADSPLVVDGKIGPKSIEAINKLNPEELVAALHAARVTFFLNLVRKNASQNVFLRGWMNRMSKLNMYANGLQIKQLDYFV